MVSLEDEHENDERQRQRQFEEHVVEKLVVILEGCRGDLNWFIVFFFVFILNYSSFGN